MMGRSMRRPHITVTSRVQFRVPFGCSEACHGSAPSARTGSVGRATTECRRGFRISSAPRDVTRCARGTRAPCQRYLRESHSPHRGGNAVLRQIVVVAASLVVFGGVAKAQDAESVIASAQKALGDPKSITYSGSAKDVAFQQCGANATQMNCQGTHDPMRPINNYVRVIDLDGAGVASHGRDEQHRARRLDDADARDVLSAGDAAAGRCLAALGRLARVLHHAVGLSERRGREQRDRRTAQGRRARTTPSDAGARR